MNNSAMTVAALQMTTTPDVDANLDQLAGLMQAAANAGATAMFTPEAFAFLGPDEGKQQIVEPLPAGGPILARCKQLAQQHACHLILGGFHEATDIPGKAANTLVHLTPQGEIAARYRKIHLFDVQLDDGTTLNESRRTEAGTACVVTELPFGTLGLSICYDMRFPALYQSLVDKGAIALTAPSAFTVPTGRAHWHTLLRARAIEAQCYMVAPAQVGHHWGKRTSFGHSLIIDPWGEVLAEMHEDVIGVITATIDPARVASVRKQLPALNHRRQYNS